jgi:FtsP/CotA-like multicopper oxidase with cupredoxin domain
MVSRRNFLGVAGYAAGAFCAPRLLRAATAPDYRIEIAPAEIELSPKHRLHTATYNGGSPGPLLRCKEGAPVTIEITNRTSLPEVVHWHGLFLPPDVDGATEEGTPFLAPGATTTITFTPRPSGFRWYHTHTMARNDLTRAQYGGQHGFLMIEPRENPARYDQEFFLALHDWNGQLLSSDDGAMNPVYEHSTINGKMMGAGEPLRVKQGDRVLLHILNSSPTEVHWVALAGHAFVVVALDGNAVATQAKVPMLRLAPAERVCAVVEMNNPGVWVLGEVRKHVQAAGMAVVVEYAGRAGSPAWQQPESLDWEYAAFARAGAEQPEEDTQVMEVPLVLESRFRGHGSMEAWTINGKSYPEDGVAPLRQGQRYRLQFINRSQDDHPMHLHRHSFEVRSVGVALEAGKDAGASPVLRGIRKDTVLAPAQSQTDVEFVADHPGDTLMHCHQQNHMDLGFMMLLRYA